VFGLCSGRRHEHSPFSSPGEESGADASYQFALTGKGVWDIWRNWIRNKLCSCIHAMINKEKKTSYFNEFRGKIYDNLEKLGL
jgi:hypothetical protein